MTEDKRGTPLFNKIRVALHDAARDLVGEGYFRSSAITYEPHSERPRLFASVTGRDLTVEIEVQFDSDMKGVSDSAARVRTDDAATFGMYALLCATQAGEAFEAALKKASDDS